MGEYIYTTFGMANGKYYHEDYVKELEAKLEAAEKRIAALESVLQYYKDECYRLEA